MDEDAQELTSKQKDVDPWRYQGYKKLGVGGAENDLHEGEADQRNYPEPGSGDHTNVSVNFSSNADMVSSYAHLLTFMLSQPYRGVQLHCQ